MSTDHAGGSTDPLRYQRIALAIGLEFYARHGRPVNREWTPRNMMRTAERLTEKKFRPRDYDGAAQELRALTR